MVLRKLVVVLTVKERTQMMKIKRLVSEEYPTVDSNQRTSARRRH